jgi:hypothetical protein
MTNFPGWNVGKFMTNLYRLVCTLASAKKRTATLLIVSIVSAGNPAMAQYFQMGSKLVGQGASGYPVQGRSVSISADGNTAIVGGPVDDFNGAAWIFTRSVGVWSQQGPKLVGTGGVMDPFQGFSVSISADGNTAIVGGPDDNHDIHTGFAGAAWIFTRSAGVWSQQGPKLVGTGANGGATQGLSVALAADGNTAIVGGYSDNFGTGAAWIFTRSAGVWTQQGGKLVGSESSDTAYLGYSVGIAADGNTAIVGGPQDKGGTGAAWIFTRTGAVWTQQGSKLVGSGTAANSRVGSSVSISGDGNTAIVGGPGEKNREGGTWIFTRTAGVWSQQGSKLVGTGAINPAAQGSSVSISADGYTAIVGGMTDNGASLEGVGAAWIFTRNAGGWSQAGQKLVGRGYIGLSGQGSAVSISENGKIAIVGGMYDDNSSGEYVGASWVFVDGTPSIASVRDLPKDQGGHVLINWTKSAGDAASGAITTSYQVWRGVRPSDVPQNALLFGREEYTHRVIENNLSSDARYIPGENSPSRIPAPAFMRNESQSGDIYWQYIDTVASAGLSDYTYACPTLADSSGDGIPWRYFFITAATADPAVYWDSPVDSGYSVDNKPPASVSTIMDTVQSGTRVVLRWRKNLTDTDFNFFEIHRSTTSGFTPDASTKIRETADTTFTDLSPSAGVINYYRVVAVDTHGNKSAPSDQVSVLVSGATEFHVSDNWNMMSVSLTVSDYHASVLYPTAVSSAFAYQGLYVTQPILANAKGYWVKFSGSQNIVVSGDVRAIDSVDVVQGWNMIGSLSSAVSVSSISTIPGGIVTSPIFGYDGAYQNATTVDPGRGYWVKVSRSGKLYLSSSGEPPIGVPITLIEQRSEAPPPPPEQADGPQSTSFPAEIALEQNYPNPFNPATVIRYSLPARVGPTLLSVYPVSLRVYNMLGQQVATLVDGIQAPGYKAVSWNASEVPSGLYYYRLTVGAYNEIKKMMLVK